MLFDVIICGNISPSSISLISICSDVTTLISFTYLDDTFRLQVLTKVRVWTATTTLYVPAYLPGRKTQTLERVRATSIHAKIPNILTPLFATEEAFATVLCVRVTTVR